MIPKSFIDQYASKSEDKQDLVNGHRYTIHTKDDVFFAWYDDFDNVFIREDGRSYGVLNVKWQYKKDADCTKGQLEFESWLKVFHVDVNLSKHDNLRYISNNTMNLYYAWRSLSGLNRNDHDLVMLSSNDHPVIYAKGQKFD